MAAGSELRATSDALPMLIEGILFVADEPVVISNLAAVLEVTPRAVWVGLEELGERLQGRGLRLQRMGDAVHLVSAPEAGAFIERFLGSEGSQRLSTAALEALAVIAYRQPVTRAMVEMIRGVNSDHAIGTLRTRGLVEEVGRAPGLGRAALLGTTVRFLEHFGLERPEDLPRLARLAELVAEGEVIDPEPHPL